MNRGERIRSIGIMHPDCAARGGAENVIFWECDELHRRGIAVSVYSRSFPADIPKSLTPVYAPIGLKLLSWPASATQLGNALSVHDAVILHNFPAAMHYGFAADNARKHGRPIPKAIWYCHEPKRPYYGDNAAHCKVLEEKRKRSLRLDEMNTVRLDKKGVAQVSSIVANSGKSAQHAAAVYGRDVGVVYPGIPDSMLAGKNAERERRFIFVSRLFALKNVFTPLIAFREFIARNPRSKETFAFVGDGPERENIRSLARSLNIADRVEVKGYVNNAELDTLIATSLAVVSVPRTEPFGLLTLEAWARRTPLILSADAGSAEIATHGENAIIVDPDNPLSIAWAMERIASPSYARSLGETGYRTLIHRYMIRHHVDGLLARLRH